MPCREAVILTEETGPKQNSPDNHSCTYPQLKFVKKPFGIFSPLNFLRKKNEVHEIRLIPFSFWTTRFISMKLVTNTLPVKQLQMSYFLISYKQY
jgi:hypothetical protein